MSRECWELKKREKRNYEFRNKRDWSNTKEISYDRYGNKDTTYRRNGRMTKRYSSWDWF